VPALSQVAPLGGRQKVADPETSPIPHKAHFSARRFPPEIPLSHAKEQDREGQGRSKSSVGKMPPKCTRHEALMLVWGDEKVLMTETNPSRMRIDALLLMMKFSNEKVFCSLQNAAHTGEDW
jgi:hypothetical protein